jgi:glycosyltransferase involved in cell wall biosynthesis
MPKFSIIVPVYNSAFFLAECLESCINQTFKDIEILCVYDYSIDNSLDILNKYAQKDSRVRLMILPANEHVGAARNIGMQNATGDYSWFVDSDDSIVLDACDVLESVIDKTNADIIRFNVISYKYDSRTKQKTIDKSRESICTWPYDRLFLKKSDYTKLKQIEVPVWSYISRTSLLKTVNFRKNSIQEDVDFTPILFSEANNIYCVNFSFYIRRKHDDSLMQRSKNEFIVASLFAANELFDYIKNKKLSRRHFCRLNLLDLLVGLKKDYQDYPGIHREELTVIVRKIFGEINQLQLFLFNFKRKLLKKASMFFEYLIRII